MSFPKYPAYKDSGVEWLGEVPEHWILKPIKHLALLNPKKSEFDGDAEQLCSFVPMEKLKTGNVLLDEERPIQEVISGYTYFEDNDVLQAKVTPCFENKNVAIAKGLTNGIGFGSTEINVLRPCNEVSPGFLYYRVQEDSYMSFCTSSMIGAGGLKRVPTEVINNFKVAVPAYPEQTQIARFLDHETVRIDSLIEEQQCLIELLKEKRQAVISHAVTKGLDPSVPMKDSGVEWLGEVPAHWEVAPVKNFFTFLDSQRIPLKAEDRGAIQGEYPYYGASGIIDYIDDFIFDEDLVLVSEDGANLLARSTPISFVAKGKYWVNNHAHILRPKDSNLIYWSEIIEQQDVTLCVTGSAQPKLTSEALGAIKIAAPPEETERAEIENFIIDVDLKLGSLLKEAASGVQLLQERRSALISAAVTGKIDLRGWQPPAGTPAPIREHETA